MTYMPKMQGQYLLYAMEGVYAGNAGAITRPAIMAYTPSLAKSNFLPNQISHGKSG